MAIRWTLLLALGCRTEADPGPALPIADPLPLPGLTKPTREPPAPSVQTFYRDADGDGFTGAEQITGDDPDGPGTEWIATKTLEDCDDDSSSCGSACHPGAAADVCDAFDNDCDRSVDEDPDLVWFRDGDGDGAGDPNITTTSCDPGPGWVGQGDDCDDALFEICDTNVSPKAAFTVIQGAISAGSVARFDATSSADTEDPSSELTFEWDFDGDGSVDRRVVGDAEASFVFAAPGVFEARLWVEDSGGKRDSRVGPVVVVDQDELEVVTSTVDAVDPLDGVVTLREAIEAANARVGPDTIAIAPNVVIALGAGSLLITDADTRLIGSEGAVIRGTVAAVDYCVGSVAPRTTILWIEVRGCPEDGIELQGSEHWVAYVKSHDNGDDGIDLEGIGNRAGPHNRSFDNGDAGFEIEGDLATIEQNLVWGNGVGLRLRGETPAHRALVIGNLIVSNRNGVTVAPEIGETSLWHNTIDGSLEVGVRYDADVNGGAGSLHDLRNNVFTRNDSAVSAAGGFAALRSNLTFANMTACAGTCSATFAVEADPEFLDPEGDYRLSEKSPGVDAGEDLGVDVNGLWSGAFQGAAPDIGAFER